MCDQCLENSKVLDSRLRESHYLTKTIYRRRECMKCGERFTTYEVDAECLKGMLEDINELVNIKEIVNAD